MLLLAEQSKNNHPSQQVAQPDRRHFAGKRLPRTVLYLAVLLGVSLCCARAQATLGSILGTVQDASGAVIPGAAVTIHSLDQDLTRQTATSDAGDFLVENLKPGHDSITVEDEGFSKAVVTDMQVESVRPLTSPTRMS
jgi:hypothetical protein